MQALFTKLKQILMHKITISLEDQFKIWNEYIRDKNDESNKIGYNAIWQQMLAITWNLAAYNAYIQIINSPSESNLKNTIFRNAFKDNYYISQSIRIRKLLILNNKHTQKDYSLASLWEDIGNFQYPPKDLINIYNSSNDASTKKSLTIDRGINIITQTFVNNVIDSRHNKIKKSIVNKINKLLLLDNNNNLKNLYNFANKYIAHASKYDDRQGFIETINSKMIEQAIKDLTISFSALYFFITCNQTTTLIFNNYGDKLNDLNDQQQRIVHSVFESIKKESEEWILCGRKIINS